MKKLAMIMLLIACFSFVACDSNETTTAINNTAPAPVEVMYYKTVNVKVSNVRKTWCSNKEIQWEVTVKDEEHNLTSTFGEFYSAMNTSSYGCDLRSGHLKVGDTIKAEMLSWKIGDKVTRRQLDCLTR